VKRLVNAVRGIPTASLNPPTVHFRRGSRPPTTTAVPSPTTAGWRTVRRRRVWR